ncbi:MAG: DUF4105 domain-containing protein [Phocaeicola sp.]
MKKFLFCKRIAFGLASLWVLSMSMTLRASEVRVSLLTCEPGSEIYALFGHTALRYEDPQQNIDWVYNYGMFSFNTPHFIFRFLRGETDYQLGITPFRYFEAEYGMRGSSVYQQTLNLSSEAKAALKRLLDDNYLPQNRIYRYNFLYDNCTTRARDVVESALGATVRYPEGDATLSYRDILHQYTAGSPWSELGIDLCLGQDADKIITSREQLFAPFFLLEAVRGATFLQGDSVHSLLLYETKAVDVEPEMLASSFPLSPMSCACLLLFLSLLITLYRMKTKRKLIFWDVLLSLLQGVAGCVIAFLFFFSTHPTVGSNWLILWMNPLSLLFLPWTLYALVKGRVAPFYWVNSISLSLFIIASPFLLQKFPVAVLPLALSLLVNSLEHLRLHEKLKK